MTVDGRTEKIKSAFYSENSDDATGETEFLLYLFKDAMPEFSLDQIDYGFAVSIPESLLGKTLDLTKAVTGKSILNISAIDGNTSIDIFYDEGLIIVEDTGSSDKNPSVTSGTLHMTRIGDDFTIKLTVTLSTGSSLFADWSGTATKVDMEN